MHLTPTALPGVTLVTAPVFGDARGFFTELFHAEKFAALGLPTAFVQDNHSRSARHTLRGLHWQVAPHAQGKLVRAVTGRVFDVAVDLRPESPTRGRWVGVTLEAGDGRSLYIPPGFAHGFLVLSEHADVTYKCTAPYHPASERSLAWNSPALAIDWPLPPGVVPVLSQRDAAAKPWMLREELESDPDEPE
ncbi:MAG: dTDP-4-dehydrorhamnose 3,5-epimerase [Gemmatimonadetes bacterium]|nr:dTDP-4-dehydrorhamnose 3,5-epimerase [Gemmatimonadota bacterium]